MKSIASFFSQCPPDCDTEYYIWSRRRNTLAILHAFQEGVISCDPDTGTIFNFVGDPLYITDASYPRFWITFNGARFGCFVHKAVWLYVNGTYDMENMEIDHIDQDPRNSRISNLQLVTKRRNRELVDERRMQYQKEINEVF